MNYPYDLQTHSYFSDGDQSPKNLAKLAHKLKMKGVILTDHNTIAGYREFKKACQELSLKTLAGVEITTRYQTLEIHILGYSVAFNENYLKKSLQSTVKGYNERSRKIIERCKSTNLANINFNNLLKKRPRGTYVTKYDIVKAVVNTTKKPKGEISKLFNAGGALYVPYGDWAMQPHEAIDIIHKANGIAILAHPGEAASRSSANKLKSIKLMNKLLNDLIKHGLDGVEIRHSKHNRDHEIYYHNIVTKKHLLMTGGSDWHGPKHHPERNIGMAGLTEKEWLKFNYEINKRTGAN